MIIMQSYAVHPDKLLVWPYNLMTVSLHVIVFTFVRPNPKCMLLESFLLPEVLMYSPLFCIFSTPFFLAGEEFPNVILQTVSSFWHVFTIVAFYPGQSVICCSIRGKKITCWSYPHKMYDHISKKIVKPWKKGEDKN